MNSEFEIVKLLEREPSLPTAAEMARQRAALEAVIERANERLARRLRRGALRTLAATLVVVGVGATAAFGVAQLAPDAKDAAVVQHQWRSSVPLHRPGWRPELDAERLVCDFRGLGLATTSVYTWASDFPLTQPLTEVRLVDECRSGTDATAGLGRTITGPATLCAVTPPGEHRAVPVVTFVPQGCAAPLSPAPPTLLDERNRLRRAEASIRAVPEECPTATEARAWVSRQIAASGEDLRLLPVETYPGGHCYLPSVNWGRAQVEIDATANDPTPGTTLPPRTPASN